MFSLRAGARSLARIYYYCKELAGKLPPLYLFGRRAREKSRVVIRANNVASERERKGANVNINKTEQIQMIIYTNNLPVIFIIASIISNERT